MNIFRIDYKIILGSHEEIPKGLLLYPGYQKDPHKMVDDDTMGGDIKIIINNKVVTKWKDIDFDKIKDIELREKLIECQKKIYQRKSQDHIVDYIYKIINSMLDAFILLIQGRKKQITVEIVVGFFDNPHELKFKSECSTLIISFICRCGIGWYVGEKGEKGIHYHETTLEERVPFELAVNEIIRSTKDFLNQLIKINQRLKEWEGYQNLEKKLIELETLRYVDKVLR